MSAETVLWYLPGAASLAVHLVLEETETPYVLRRVVTGDDGTREAGLLAVNPDGRVPVLELDGTVLTESAAICLVLAERDPERRLLPPAGTGSHARTLRALVLLTNTVQETLLRMLYPTRYVDEPAAAPAVERAARRRLETLFDRIEAELEDGFLVGDRLTVADLYLFMVVRWGRHLEPPAWSRPRLRDHWLRLAARPAVARVLADEGLSERPA